ncbi:MAG: TauD/TfdA family dioxygenase [Sneathiella sp.]
MHDYSLELEVKKAGMAAEILNIDLSIPAADRFIKAINRAFQNYKILIFRKQNLSAKQQIAFSQLFGDLEIHVVSQFNHPDFPEIFRLSNRKGENGEALGAADGGSYWHSDLSFQEKPAKITILHALEIPETPANTQFVDMGAAYSDLPKITRTKLDGKFGVHAYRTNKSLENGTQIVLSSNQLNATPPVIHPIFRTHPETGEKSIYAFPGIVQKIEDMPDAEATSELKALFEHCMNKNYRYDHCWEVGDVVLWDNRCLMHRATSRALPADAYRSIHRTTVVGDRPF